MQKTMKVHFIVFQAVFSAFFMHQPVWQPLAESNRSYLDENQMS